MVRFQKLGRKAFKMRNNINKSIEMRASKSQAVLRKCLLEWIVLVRVEYAVSGGPCSTYWKSGF